MSKICYYILINKLTGTKKFIYRSFFFKTKIQEIKTNLGTGIGQSDKEVATIGGVELQFKSISNNGNKTSISFYVKECPLGDNQQITLVVPGKGVIFC